MRSIPLLSISGNNLELIAGKLKGWRGKMRERKRTYSNGSDLLVLALVNWTSVQRPLVESPA